MEVGVMLNGGQLKEKEEIARGERDIEDLRLETTARMGTPRSDRRDVTGQVYSQQRKRNRGEGRGLQK